MRPSSAALLRLRCAITSALRGAGLLEPARSRSGDPIHRLTELGAELTARGAGPGPDGPPHGIPELYVELLRAYPHLPAVSPDLVVGGDWSGPGHSMRLGRIEDEAGEVAILRGTVERLTAELSGIMGRHLEQLERLTAELDRAEPDRARALPGQLPLPGLEPG